MLRLIVVLLMALAPVTALGDARVAFIVGNATYENAPPLSNPANDARLVARTLKGLGFEVDSHTNLSRWEISAELSDFLERTEGADLTLFYFAGHGMQYQGRNYLLGTDAELRSELDIQAEALGLDQITRLLRKNSRAALIFVDACRDNPVATNFYRRTLPETRSAAPQGLVAPQERFEGAMVTFSASPGQVAYDGKGAYSPFAEALAEHLPTPNIEILTLMKRVIGDVRSETGERQVPMVSNDLSREIYLLEQAALPVQTAPEDFVSELDRVYSAAQDVGTERGWALFLNRFPQSRYQDEALAAWEAAILADSDDPDEAARALEARLAIDGATVREAQQALSAFGFDVGATDGELGPRTRRAITAFQTSRSLPATGALTIRTAQELGVRLRPRGLIPMPNYSSRKVTWYRAEQLSALEFDERLHKAAAALERRNLVYGFHDGKLYIVMMMPRNWLSLNHAQKYARDAGGHLAVIGSRAENDFIYDLVRHDRRFWINCNANNCFDVFGPSFGFYQVEGSREPAGGWRWVTDERVAFTNWTEFSPGNYGGGNSNLAAFFKHRGQIGQIFHDKRWHDLPGVPTAIVIEID